MIWVDLTVKILQGVFFLTLAVVGVLAYLKAKRTLLQPMHTEVFKQQLRIMNELSSHFIGKGEYHLRRDLDFNSVLRVNFSKLLDDYASVFFNKKFVRDDRPYNLKDCPTSVVRRDALKLADDYLRPEGANLEESRDRRAKADVWSDYKFQEVSLTRAHTIAIEDIERLSRSPLLPEKCGRLVAEYVEAVEENEQLIGKILNEGAKELPGKYPNEETLKRAATGWINNRYLGESKALEPLARGIEAFLREYLGTDTLLSG